MKTAPEQLAFETAPPPLTAGEMPRGLRIDGKRHALEVARSRLVIAGAVISMLSLVLVGRLAHLGLWQSDPVASLASMQSHGYASAARRPIVDRNGAIIATSLEGKSLYADPASIIDPADAAHKVVAVLPELSFDRVLAKLKSKGRFVWLKRGLTPQQQYALNALGLPGLEFKREIRRIYPKGSAFAHAVGYAGVDNHGLAGLEMYLDEELADPHGRHGDRPLELSLDTRVQHALRAELSRAMVKHRAVGASGLVLNVRNGEVLALVSLPDFDPNRVDESSKGDRFNRTTLGVYELGSVFKIFTTAMALEKGTVTLNDGYDATDPIRIARFTIRDDHAKRRWLSVPEIFIYSSNIGAAKMAIDVGGVEQKRFLGRLGLLRRTDLELPEKSLPLFPAKWREVNTMTIAFGHGLAVSPLHLASAVAATINGGVLYPATLLKRDAKVSLAGTRVMTAQTSDQLRRLLRLVVEKGTGRKAAVPGYLVGGKTGTAEKSGAGGYRRDALVSSFIGAFPMTEPRYLVFAMLDEPVGTKDTFNYATGGWTAAPVVARVVARIAPLMDVRPADPSAPEVRRALHLPFDEGKARLASF